MTTTIQRVELDTKDGKKFLRRVIRDNQTFDWDEEWRIDARPSTEWKLRFYRTQKGELGDGDNDIEVQTEHAVRLPSERETGDVKSFSDSQSVFVPRPLSLLISSCDVATVAQFLLDGYSLRIEASAGSSNSSEFGLSFIYVLLQKRKPDGRTLTVQLQGDTVAKDGRPICSGAVSVS